MKRIFAFALAAACLLFLLPVTACGGGQNERDAYRICAEYEEGVLSAEMQFSHTNGTGEPLSFLEFNLFGNAYREDAAFRPVSDAFSAAAYYAGESYGGMEILSVSPCAAWEVCGQDENVLRVQLARPLRPGERTDVSVSWTLELARVEHRTGIAERAVNLGNFYPVLCVLEGGEFYECEYYADGDPFYSACADYFLSFRADADYTLAASGRILSAEEEGTKKTYTLELYGARDLALVLSKEFSVAQGEACGAQVMYYYYDDPEPARSLALAEESLTYFSEMFGSYPYPVFSAVQTGFAVGGMEYPALVMIGDHLTGVDRAYTLVHEAAHQWWYAAVGSNQLEHAWMDEGLAEYSAALFFDAHDGYGLTEEGLCAAAERAYRAFYSVQEQIFGRADTAMDKKLGEFLSEYQYVVLAYNKGMLLFRTLRQTFGDKKFFAALRRYYADLAGGIASPQDLVLSFKRAGADASGILRSFADGSAVL